jgi:hypothetical protein
LQLFVDHFRHTADVYPRSGFGVAVASFADRLSAV